ncbi:hypothetical protein [Sporosarcina highlanderae]|uniref:Uncharacterized protein n=1 Tax=Sporosarcina highlanderae TaxID=3035916 RepID=A0ABT8JNF0_9BACL|nr:hypothetical protein [Sporosarcina highlanderae]MDN4606684.1 hypothetical protein [Sporosarcina highlanderae]
MGYFFLSFDSIMATNVAKAIATINDSNTDMGITPGLQDVGHAIVAARRGELRLPSSEPSILKSPIQLLFYYTIHTFLID